MDMFPTTWELLLPNWTVFTVIGVMIFIVLIFDAMLLSRVITKTIAKVFMISGAILNFYLISIALILIFGVSMLQDFFSSTGFLLIFFGTLVTLLVAYLLFANDINKFLKKR